MSTGVGVEAELLARVTLQDSLGKGDSVSKGAGKEGGGIGLSVFEA